jgi:pimeloyl-ACP methyl ester carboxylesterase
MPATHYATTDDGVNIAYQVLGEGTVDLVFTAGWLSNIAYAWEQPLYARFYRRLASFSRLIIFDKRGLGLSDRVDDVASIDGRIDDFRCVMDAAGSGRAVVFGSSEGGAMAALFAATHPHRVSALILYGSFARLAWAPDWPLGFREEQQQTTESEFLSDAWCVEFLRDVMPSMSDDESFRRWFLNFCRMTGSPRDVAAIHRVIYALDIRSVLPTIHVPTLVIHRKDDSVPVEHGRYLASHITGARLVELPGADHAAFLGASDDIVDEVEEFLTGTRNSAEIDRVLTSILFTDIVGSTRTATRLGDRAWRGLLEHHHATVRTMLARYQGHEIDTAGDGFFATFDGPGRAVRCAIAIVEAVRSLGIEVRTGLHAGEVEILGDKVGGIAVAIAARVKEKAGPSQVLVSQTVKDLVAGSGFTFEDTGEHELKGVPDRWRLYRVVDR